ncbi:AraC family transcriptional regulator [Amycolatopsis acididurans]|uniref:AraC family transcriptional regulator n=1 Tax=Amycolatopsis acididurans TaxID=2724524 RepID=UPI0028B105AA|nr:helix-turn-helix domain-containing protein [Amycolatopsis acididurans]
MRTATRLATRPEFTLRVVECRDDHRGWSAPEQRAGRELVLARHGRFRRRVRGQEFDIDPTIGYLSAPGDEEHFAHPAGGDLCTSISLDERLWPAEHASSPVYVDARLDLAHRRLLAVSRRGDVDYALVERLLGLLGAALAHTGRAPQRDANARRLAARAREAILAAHPAADGLLPLAAHLGVSPYRLSRTFTRETGVSLTHYRNRVRVAHALDRLEAGETNLALLAAELGFADQAHLTRTVRAHAGHTPAALRALLQR